MGIPNDLISWAHALGQLVDALSDVGALASLDQVQALGACPELTVRLLLRADADRVVTRLGLERYGGPTWIDLTCGLGRRTPH